jgi:mannitol-1-phosphate 5-dehydrogenase
LLTPSSLHKSGYEVVFADVQEAVIDQLNKHKSYKVIQVGSGDNREDEITNYRAINSKQNEAQVVHEIITADVVTCSVGPNILKFIAPVIAKGLHERSTALRPVAVIACENMIGATDQLERHIKADPASQRRLAEHAACARYANSAIDRIVPAQDADAGLDVKLEKFYEWVVDATPFEDHEPPPIKGIKWVADLIPYIERKLYTVNTAHGASAYFGHHFKKATVYEAMQDPTIVDAVRKCLAETSELIVSKHGIAEKEQAEYAETILERISNPHLEDAVERVGRAPLRKLGRKERFIGPAAELAEHDKACDGLLAAVDMCLRFQDVAGDEESAQLAKIMAEKEAGTIVAEVCGLEQGHKLFDRVVAIVARVQEARKE